MALQQEGAARGDLADDDGDEALRQIEDELAVVEEAMAERQRSLVEVDQRLNDLQTAPSCIAAALRPILDPVAEAAGVEEMGATPLLQKSRSAGSGLGEVAVLVTNGDTDSGAGPTEIAHEDVVKSAESPTWAALKTPRSFENIFNTQQPGQQKVSSVITSRPVSRMQSLVTESERLGPAMAAVASGSSVGTSVPTVTRMYSVPSRSPPVTHGDTSPRGQRPLILSGSSRGADRWDLIAGPGAGRANLFSYPSTAPWLTAMPGQQKTNASAESLPRCSPSPLAPAASRGSSVPPEARRIFSTAPGQATAASPSMCSPRSSPAVGSSVLGSMTPRQPHAAVLTGGSGYSVIAAPVTTGSLDLATPRARSPERDRAWHRSMSAGPELMANMPYATGGNVSPMRVVAAPFTQYGNRFSAVAAASPGPVLGPPIGSVPSGASTSLSRTATPQPLHRTATPQPLASARFVPVSGPAFVEAQRGRGSSLGPAPQRATSVSTRACSPPPGAMSVGFPMTSAGSRTPVAGSSITTAPGRGVSVTTTGAPSVEDVRAQEPVTASRAPNVASVAMAAAAAARNARHGLGGNPPGPGTPQPPSRYAYVNSVSNPRDLRRRGRI